MAWIAGVDGCPGGWIVALALHVCDPLLPVILVNGLRKILIPLVLKKLITAAILDHAKGPHQGG